MLSVAPTRAIRLPVLLVLAAAGCNRSPAGPPEIADVRPYVTESAAAALTASGTFLFPEPVPPGALPIIASERARLLAAAYVRSFGESLERYWESDRGRSIDVPRLQPQGRVYYVETPFGDFPEGYHPGFVHAFGPYYLVSMGTSGDAAELTVAVAAYATRVEITPAGKTTRPVGGGNEFVSRGVPVDGDRALPPPEQAVVRVARFTNALVNAVPQMIRPVFPEGPTDALWKISLDRPVAVRTADGVRVEVRTLYAGPASAPLRVAAPEQPAVYRTTAIRADDTGDEPVPEWVEVPIRPGHAITFDTVVVEPAS